MTPWTADGRQEPLRAAVIVAMLEHREALLDPWLAFPQQSCSFTVGDPGTPMPVGCLFRLWDTCPEMTGPCPLCDGAAYGFAFGGLLSHGGVVGTCTVCEARLFRELGGLGTVARIMGPHLMNTAYALRSGGLGGGYGAEGQALLAQLRRLGAPV